MTIAEQLEQRGIEKGFEIGIKIGERSVLLKIARELLQNGVELSIVMKSTGLSEDDLAKLCPSLGLSGA